MPLVMRLETAAAKFEQLVKPASRREYNLEAADTRDLLLEAARRIKELESRPIPLGAQDLWFHEIHDCGN